MQRAEIGAYFHQRASRTSKAQASLNKTVSAGKQQKNLRKQKQDEALASLFSPDFSSNHQTHTSQNSASWFNLRSAKTSAGYASCCYV